MKCILLYDKKIQLPVAVFDNLKEASVYLGRDTQSISSSISRFRRGIRNSITDIKGHKYEPYYVEINEE